MRNYSKALLALGIFFLLSLVVCNQSFAQDPFQAFFNKSEQLTDRSVGRSQNILLGLSGLGALGIGALAFFGRFTWSRFFILIASIVIISSAQYGIKYLTGQDAVFNTTAN